MRNALWVAFLFCSVIPARAQLTGYVVKVDSRTVYLDLVAANGVTLGQDFVIFTEGEELKHPITGASLGRVEHQAAKGHIEQIMDKYSMGQLDSNSPAAVSSGQKIRMLSSFTQSAVPIAQPAQVAPSVSAAPPAQPGTLTSILTSIGVVAPPSAMPGSRVPIWKSPPVDMEAVDIAVADINGDGKPEIVLADASRVVAYPEVGEWKPVCQYTNSGTGSKILSIDAADLKKSGHADVFVTYYDAAFQHVQTAVLECKGNTFETVTTLPFMTRAFQDASGEVKLGTQQLLDDRTFPFGSLYLLEYKDGKYTTGAQIKAKRLEWLYGFTLAKDSAAGQIFPIFITQNYHLRAQFKKKAWVSDEDYAQTPNRLTWQGRDQPMMFYPRLATTQKNGGLDGLYVLENVPSLGSLGGAFGYFHDAKLHFLRWDGLSLKQAWVTDGLGGYAADFAVARSGDGQAQEIWIAAVGAEGQTSVLKFQP